MADDRPYRPPESQEEQKVRSPLAHYVSEEFTAGAACGGLIAGFVAYLVISMASSRAVRAHGITLREAGIILGSASLGAIIVAICQSLFTRVHNVTRLKNASSEQPQDLDTPSTVCSATSGVGRSHSARSRRTGTAIGTVGLLLGAAPSLFILHGALMAWWELATMPKPPEFVRPMGFAAAACLATGVGLVICSPICLLLSWLARRLGSETGAMLAILGASLFACPFMIGQVAVFVVCGATGVRLAP